MMPMRIVVTSFCICEAADISSMGAESRKSSSSWLSSDDSALRVSSGLGYSLVIHSRRPEASHHSDVHCGCDITFLVSFLQPFRASAYLFLPRDAQQATNPQKAQSNKDVPCSDFTT